jgi:hypothetical protein
MYVTLEVYTLYHNDCSHFSIIFDLRRVYYSTHMSAEIGDGPKAQNTKLNSSILAGKNWFEHYADLEPSTSRLATPSLATSVSKTAKNKSCAMHAKTASAETPLVRLLGALRQGQMKWGVI